MQRNIRKIGFVMGFLVAMVLMLVGQRSSENRGQSILPAGSLPEAHTIVSSASYPLASCDSTKIEQPIETQSDFEFNNKLAMNAMALLPRNATDPNSNQDLKTTEIEIHGTFIESMPHGLGGNQRFLALTHADVRGGDPELKTWLEQGFAVQMSEKGTAVSIGVSPSTKPEFAQFARMLAPLLSMTRADSPTSKQWEAWEPDPSGTVKTSYFVTDKGIERKRSEVIATKQQEFQDRLAVKFDSEFLLKPLGTALCHVDVSGLDRLAMTDTGHRIIAESTSKVRREHSGGRILTESEVHQILSKMEVLQFVAIDRAADTSQVTEKDRFQKMIQNMPWKDLLAQLTDSKKLSEDEGKLFELLRAHLVVNPGHCSEVKTMLDSFPHDSRQAEMLALALTAAGHKEAQETLLELADKQRSADPKFSFKLMGLLAMVETPVQEAADRLRAMRQDRSGPSWLNNSLELVEASVAHKRMEQDPSSASQIEKLLLSEYTTANSPRRQQILSVLGNLGTEDILDLVETDILTSDVETRIRMVNAVRFVSDPRATEWLIEVLARDAAPEVKLKAIYALSFRSISSDNRIKLSQVLLQENSETVKGSIESILQKGRSA